MVTKKRILLKITGTVFLSKDNKSITVKPIKSIIQQIKKLKSEYQFGIVIGGGNFFRGEQHGTQLGLTPSIGHQIGILSTMLNGLMIKDICNKEKIENTLLSAIECPAVARSISHQSITKALEQDKVLIFTAGTGNPFFTNDTNAVLRSLQITATQVWKGTNVDGVYTKDPSKFKDAKLVKKLTYQEALKEKYAIMDATAIALAETYDQTIRVFDIFEPDALIHAAQDKSFGSTISAK